MTFFQIFSAFFRKKTISQGSVTKFVSSWWNLQWSVKEFRKSVNIWRKYGQELGVRFLTHGVW